MGFIILWNELKERFLAPIGHVTFWAYLIVGVLLFGGLAVWLEACLYFAANVPESATHVRIALVAFFPALIGSVSVELLFQEAGRNKRIMAFAIVVVCISLVIGLALILIRSISNTVAIPIAALASLFAVLEWWIANGPNPTFQDFNFEAPVGGPPSQNPSGDLTGYRT